MPPLSTNVPAYRKHKSSGQAVVTLNGQDNYLGPHGTRTSKAAYDRKIAEWLANDRQPPLAAGDSLTILEAIARYWRHARAYYRKHGRPTGEQAGIRAALRVLRQLYEDTLASEFSALGLKAVRNQMIDAGLARSTINQNIGRIRRMFKWLAAEQLVPIAVYQSLIVLDGLRKGRTAAREPAPVAPVDDLTVDATLPFMPATVADMVRVQRLTGCRPEEVCQMRLQDLDRSDEIWRYIPGTHKVEHHSLDRVIFVGPRAQAILLSYLDREADAYCFRPVEAEASRRAAQHANRKAPLRWGTKPGDRRKRRPNRTPGDCYSTDSYRRAIERACDKAFPPLGELGRQRGETARAWMERLTEPQKEQLQEWQTRHRWTPHRLRHSAGTEIRRKFGVEASRCVLGHTRIATTELYSERDYGVAVAVAQAIG